MDLFPLLQVNAATVESTHNRSLGLRGGTAELVLPDVEVRNVLTSGGLPSYTQLALRIRLRLGIGSLTRDDSALWTQARINAVIRDDITFYVDNQAPLQVSAKIERLEAARDIIRYWQRSNEFEPYEDYLMGLDELRDAQQIQGLDVNVRDHLGRTPLDVARERNYQQAIAVLLAAGAQPD